MLLKIWPLWHGHVYVRKTTFGPIRLVFTAKVKNVFDQKCPLQIVIYSADGVIVQWIAYFGKQLILKEAL